jgi:lipopolysaccharide/colanic/teichoic acid biosynthesis glycosyltransferase
MFWLGTSNLSGWAAPERKFGMRTRSPVSRGSFSIRFSTFDVVWALITPLLALWISNAPVLSTPDDWPMVTLYTVGIYSAVASGSSLVAFLLFRTRDGMTHLFSVNDALDVTKAVLVAAFLTYLALFSLTRLEGIPRSTPLIHAMLLTAGLLSARAFVRAAHSDRDRAPTVLSPVEHIILIGSNKLSALYIDFLRAYTPDRNRVIGVLDDRAEMVGRSIAGIRVLGPTIDLLPIINEFKEHGIRTDRVIVGGDPDFLSKEAMVEISHICTEYEIELDYVPRLVGLNTLRAPMAQNQPERAESNQIGFSPSSYFGVKHFVDFALSLLLTVVLLPIFLVIAVAVLFDVGSPIFFWQRRVGINGQGFHIHKFRTLKPAYDDQGRSTADRVSRIGALVRKSRLDELPQLLNVLVGDMSLIGPRPLLPHDQPSDATARLMVRPGITGWAQVNGGKLITPEEKNALDEWYVRNASLWLDLKIIGKTIVFMFGGETRHAQAQMNSTAIGTSVQPAE